MAGGEGALGGFVEAVVIRVSAKPVAETEHTVDLDIAGREDVHIGIRLEPAQEAVFVPIALANGQDVASGFEQQNVVGLIC